MSWIWTAPYSWSRTARRASPTSTEMCGAASRSGAAPFKPSLHEDFCLWFTDVDRRVRGACGTSPPDSTLASRAYAKRSAYPAWPSRSWKMTRSRWRRDSASRNWGSSDPVDADTIFMTGSTGKAFTVAALGVLVDQGKIGWDDKVIDRLPGFQMYDPWVTREMTIRDLLVHRSGLGLGAGDLFVRTAYQLEPRRIGAPAALYKARNQFSQRLCLRQCSIHGCGAVNRGCDGRDVGEVHP